METVALAIGCLVIVLGVIFVVGVVAIFAIERVIKLFDLTVTICHFALKKKGFRAWRRQKMALYDLVTLKDHYKLSRPDDYASLKEKAWQEARDALADDGSNTRRKDD